MLGIFFIYPYMFTHIIQVWLQRIVSFQTFVNLLKAWGKCSLCSNFPQWTWFHTDLFQEAKMEDWEVFCSSWKLVAFSNASGRDKSLQYNEWRENFSISQTIIFLGNEHIFSTDCVCLHTSFSNSQKNPAWTLTSQKERLWK